MARIDPLPCVLLGLTIAGLMSCRVQPAPAVGSGVVAAPSDSEIPHDAFGAAVRRGLALLTATRESLPAHVGNALRCTSCHLDQGRRDNGSWIGAYARFPQYRSRRGAVELI